jgi:hypothetical protein
MRAMILEPMTQEVEKFFLRSDILIFDHNIKEYLYLKQGTSFQGMYTPIFIEQCLEISRFTMNFFTKVYETPYTSSLESTDISIFDVLQRQLLMNLNWNFTSIKSDFLEPLNLLRSYISLCLDISPS